METLARVTDDIWECNAPLKLPGLRMDHRMTVVRLSSGELVVHSPLRFEEPLRDAVRDLGEPKWFVAPSRYHDMYWPEWFREFPAARFVGVPGLKDDHPELPFTGILEENSRFWGGEMKPIPVRGMPRINEVALLLPATRTLIVADLIFNLDVNAQNAFGRLFLRLNGIHGRPGISRLFRAFVKDRFAFRDSIQELLSLELDRIIIGHGQNPGGKDVLERAAKEAGILAK